jgi:hypothetical protein
MLFTDAAEVEQGEGSGGDAYSGKTKKRGNEKQARARHKRQT